MERNLVSIQRVEALTAIPNADAIEQAKVLGWSLVVKKGEFKPGDLCVFFEIDSVLPDDKEWAEFMRPRKFRVKTVKFKGALSQGLALPTEILGNAPTIDPSILTVNRNVQDILHVRKYEPIFPDTRLIEGIFPPEIPKTDEIRIQSLVAAPGPNDTIISILSEIKDRTVYISTKLDGMSTTFYRPLDDGLVRVCSRNWELKRSENNYASSVCLYYNLDSKLPPGYALQGELCGPGIQKNRLNLSKIDFFVFNVFEVKTKHFLDFGAFCKFCDDVKVKTVPIEAVLVCPDWTLEQWLDRAEGFYSGTKNRKEGIVVRPVVEAYSNVLGGRLSFKVISNSFLLKDEE